MLEASILDSSVRWNDEGAPEWRGQDKQKGPSALRKDPL